MEMQQIIEMLARMDANRKIDKEEMTENMDANQAKAGKTLKETLAKMEVDRKADKKQMLVEMKANQTRMDANMGSMKAELKSTIKDMKINGEEAMACQETVEERLEEEKPASMELKPEVADEEVPLEDAIVMPVREPRKRHRDRRHLAAQCRQKKEQKRTQRKDGYRKNLVIARRAAVAWRRINVFRKILTHGYCGLQKEVTAARMRITCCAGHGHKGRNKEIVQRETA
jgi:hypothetical protein